MCEVFSATEIAYAGEGALGGLAFLGSDRVHVSCFDGVVGGCGSGRLIHGCFSVHGYDFAYKG